MTDEQNTPLPAPAPVASPVPAKDPRPSPARLGGLARTLLALSLLLAVAALAAAGYLFYLQQQSRVESAQEQSRLTRQLGDSSQQLTQLQNQLQQATQQLQQDRQILARGNESRELLQARMAALEKQIAQVTGSHRIDWMLKEAEHFVMVAERRLSLLGDAGGALTLLQEADGITRAMEEPAARPLREALRKDIHNLKLAAETSVDVDGIFLRIEQLASRIPALNIPRYELYQESPAAIVADTQPDNGIDLFLTRMGAFLKSLVRFEKHDKSRPMLLTAQRDYLAQNLALLLDQAQLALLRGDNDAFRVSLREARNRVDSYLQLQTSESRLFITELDALASVKLRPPVPVIEDSVRAVQVFRDYWSREKLLREQALQKIETGSGAAEAQP